jgi:hypothetical protein
MRNIISDQRCIGLECRRCADQIVEQQRRAGVRVIKVPHALGFLDSELRLLISEKEIENTLRIGC